MYLQTVKKTTITDTKSFITYRGGLPETAASMLAYHKALIRPSLVMHVFLVPQRFAR